MRGTDARGSYSQGRAGPLRRIASASIALLTAVAVFQPVAAFANSPGPLLVRQIARDPALAARLADIDRSALARGVNRPARPHRTGAPAKGAAGVGDSVSGGVLKTLVLLVDFSDHPAQVAPSFFDSLIFADVYGPASVRGYYREASYGTPTQRGLVDVVTYDAPSTVGWIRLPQTLSYYAGDAYGQGFYPRNSQGMVADALAAADPYIDFSKYDGNSDGVVDNLVIVHAGEGAEYSSLLTGHIWSHAWSLFGTVTRDGVRISGYSTEPEYWVAPGDMTIGVYAHEFGHILGLPDLYDTDLTSEGVGDWSLMSGGDWAGILKPGDCPTRLDAWSAAQLGWLQPQTASESMTVSLSRSGASRTGAWKVYPRGATSTKEYWLIENRQLYGTDAGLPGAGLLIWHIDENQANNNDENHKLVDLEEAGGIQHMDFPENRGGLEDPFPGSGDQRVFSVSTVPDSRTYLGVDSKLNVQAISDSAATMTASISTMMPGDAFSGSVLTEAFGSHAAYIDGATMQFAEPAPVADPAIGSSLWYEWQAPRDGAVYFATTGSDFDTVLGVYTGSTLGALSEVASDDDGDGGTASIVGFTASAGTIYRIQLGGQAGAWGRAVLSWGYASSPVLRTPRVSGRYSHHISATFVGAVSPGHKTTVRVTIQIRSGRSWRTVRNASVRTTSTGSWSYRIRLRAGTYRVRAYAPYDTRHLSAFSGWRTIRVR
ncbi:MAG: M6 family metalloprotease domain-containing protein [Coriobacteriia bacterium]|nr:M6 family metalloprotease domain-containing protein [Coriobacteriia bacterium]